MQKERKGEGGLLLWGAAAMGRVSLAMCFHSPRLRLLFAYTQQEKHVGMGRGWEKGGNTRTHVLK